MTPSSRSVGIPGLALALLLAACASPRAIVPTPARAPEVVVDDSCAAREGLRVELVPLNVTRTDVQRWALRNRGSAPFTVWPLGGQLFVLARDGSVSPHPTNGCGTFEYRERVVAPGDSVEVEEHPMVGYHWLGAGRYRFEIELTLDGGSRAFVQSDFDFGAYTPDELRDAHWRALDPSLEACAWYPRYVGCALEATPEPERIPLVRALADRGAPTLGAIVDALTFVDDEATVLAMRAEGSDMLRLHGTAAFLRGRFSLWERELVHRPAAHATLADGIRRGVTSPGLLRASAVLFEEPPELIEEALVERLDHEQDPLVWAWILHDLTRFATRAPDRAHRVSTLLRAIDSGRARLSALREAPLDSFVGQIEGALEWPESTGLPSRDVIEQLYDSRGDTTRAECAQPAPIVARTLDGCRERYWMRAGEVTTRVRWAEPACVEK